MQMHGSYPLNVSLCTGSDQVTKYHQETKQSAAAVKQQQVSASTW